MPNSQLMEMEAYSEACQKVLRPGCSMCFKVYCVCAGHCILS